MKTHLLYGDVMKSRSLFRGSRLLVLVPLFLVAALPGYSDTGGPRQIQHGEMLYVDTVTITGNKRTKDFVIRQEFTFKEGEKYTPEELGNRLKETERRLMNLGVFSEVAARILTSGPKKHPGEPDREGIETDVIVRVQDRWTFFPLPLYYADNKLGHIIGFNIQDFNLLGLGQSVHLKGLYNPYLKSLFLTWHYPRFLGSWFSVDLDVGYKDYVDFEYRNDAVAYEANIGTLENNLRLGLRIPVARTEIVPFVGYNLTHSTSEIVKNETDKQLKAGTRFIVNGGLHHGIINRQTGTVWGGNNEVKVLYSLLGQDPESENSGSENTGSEGEGPEQTGAEGAELASVGLELLHAKYFRIFNKSTFAYSVRGLINPFEELQLNSLDVRGIKIGRLRGNYGLHGNIDFRFFITDFHLIFDFNLFMVAFADFGNYFMIGETLEITDTPITAGIGTRVYIKQVGGPGKGGRFDFGINFQNLAEGKSWDQVLFVALAFDEMF